MPEVYSVIQRNEADLYSGDGVTWAEQHNFVPLEPAELEEEADACLLPGLSTMPWWAASFSLLQCCYSYLFSFSLCYLEENSHWRWWVFYLVSGYRHLPQWRSSPLPITEA